MVKTNMMSPEKYSKDEKAEIRDVLIKSFELKDEKLRNIDRDIIKLKEELYGENFSE